MWNGRVAFGGFMQVDLLRAFCDIRARGRVQPQQRRGIRLLSKE